MRAQEIYLSRTMYILSMKIKTIGIFFVLVLLQLVLLPGTQCSVHIYLEKSRVGKAKKEEGVESMSIYEDNSGKM